MDKQKRLGVALAIYAVLGMAAWLTMSAEPVALGSNRQVSLRLLTLIVLAFFALRTLLAWKADQLRMKDTDAGRQDDRGAEFKGLM